MSNGQNAQADPAKGNGQTTQADLVKEMIPVATILILVYAAVGGILVIISAVGGDDITKELRLSFKDYLEQMAIAIGALTIGRGILANAKKP
jgi:small neutral amino acid transporter SnatA (MarC family)